MIKRNLIFCLCIFLATTFKVFGTAQVPDILIYNGDTLALYANPLEDFYNEDNPRPKSFGLQGGWSTACWRGYQATWIIENDLLYLIEIGPCHFYRKYELTSSRLDSLTTVVPEEVVSKIKLSRERMTFSENELDDFLKKKIGKKDFRKYKETIRRYSKRIKKTADLKTLFPERYSNDKVSANWFSGMLRVPKGELLEYVHMGYMSTYEYELVFELEEGEVIDSREYSNQGGKLQEGFGILSATSYSMAVPLQLLDGENYEYAMTDTIEYSNLEENIMLNCSSRFNGRRLNPELRREKVKITLDSLINSLSAYKFENPVNDNLRWGTAGWVDGINDDSEEFVRVFTMANINGQVIVIFRSRNSYEEFYRVAQYLVQTTRLMEFGF